MKIAYFRFKLRPALLEAVLGFRLIAIFPIFAQTHGYLIGLNTRTLTQLGSWVGTLSCRRSIIASRPWEDHLQLTASGTLSLAVPMALA